jgi:glycosyltransferase involved in cell wall biosynthesis
MEKAQENLQINPKLSIIVPIYNVEQYLPTCLDSLVNQTLRDIEIVLVDDLSTDESRQIMLDYAKKDNRIKNHFSATNLGSGGARNIGISLAKGDYITFVDADDWLELDAYKYCVETIIEKQADILGFALKSYTQEGVFIATYSTEEQTLEGIDILKFYLKDQILVSVWNKIYKRSLFRDLQNPFPLHRYYEDMVGTFQILRQAHRFVNIDSTFYCYRRREGSVTKSISLQHITDYALNFSDIISININQGLGLDIELQYYFTLHAYFCYQRIITQAKEGEVCRYLDLYQQYLGKFSILGVHRHIQEKNQHAQWLASQINQLTQEHAQLAQDKTDIEQNLYKWHTAFAPFADDYAQQVMHSKIFRLLRLLAKAFRIYQERGIFQMLKLAWRYLMKKI